MSDLAAGRRSSLSRWALAGLAALALHGGLAALAYIQAQRADTDVALGAPAIDIGLVMTAPHTEPSDLPPNAVAEDAAASQAMPEQQAKIEKTDLPKDEPTAADDPDRLVSENPEKKPEETPPKPETVRSKASEESIPSEAAAPPPSEKAMDAPRSAAPIQGIGDSDRRVIASWERQLVAYLDHRKRYPRGAAPRDATILIEFSIDRLGHLLTARVANSSGDSAFDEAAVAVLRRASPVPPPPALLADESLSFSIPVVFRRNRR